MNPHIEKLKAILADEGTEEKTLPTQLQIAKNPVSRIGTDRDTRYWEYKRKPFVETFKHSKETFCNVFKPIEYHYTEKRFSLKDEVRGRYVKSKV